MSENEDLSKYEEVRNELLQFVRGDLVGPYNDEVQEELPGLPHLDHYIAGILYPQPPTNVNSEDYDAVLNSENVNPDEASDQDDDMTEAEEMEIEKKIYNLSSAYMPSSMGFSCTLDEMCELTCDIKTARYETIKKKNEDQKETKSEEDAEAAKLDKQLWKRIPINHTISISKEVFKKGSFIKVIVPNLKLVVLYRADRSFLTLSLVNEATVAVDKSKGRMPAKAIAEACFYQVEMSLKSKNEDAVFLPRRQFESHDAEEKKYELLFRNKQTFAVGHGCAAIWNEKDRDRTSEIKTSSLPLVRVPHIDFDIIKDSGDKLCLNMQFLSEMGKEKVDKELSSLSRFCDLYESWVGKQDEDIKGVPAELVNAASRNISECRKSLDRMRGGVSLLAKDKVIRKAFALMNQAMIYQRYGSQSKDAKLAAQWRPFQLGYILLTLKSLTDPHCEDRDIVDLIWFPTGGGKTEAYLGAAAFTIFYRRLFFKETGAGTAVIMRYTLRLLTTQQLQRAAKMICACEYIRRQHLSKELGDETFAIGLWVGEGAAPNDVASYQRQLNDEEFSPMLAECPSCSGKIDHRKAEPRIFCLNQGCDFRSGIPLYFIDEDIYKNPPTLIISTVDKFAALSRRADADNKRADTARLFGADDASRNEPPSLIIQDELHLISGAIGTMVGLFETVVDELCSFRGTRPKIIAATATIRGAQEQCRNLFQRQVSQFPAQALDIRNSFFSVETDLSLRKGRQYVGIQAAGHTLTTTEIRVMSALLQGIHNIKLQREDAGGGADVRKYLDPYWTLITYFNSIRELGKCHSLIEQDIARRMNALSARTGKQQRYISARGVREMTGNRQTRDIRTMLGEMENTIIDGDALDIVLTTNMFSVGVDIPRLGAMVITTQPKTNAEYIQASSRIGREYPGLVFTIYDFSRSRDRSYYEDFYGYHRAFYRHVEATTLTPFSAAALERGVQSIIIALLRNRFRRMGLKNSLKIDASTLENILTEVRSIILKRVTAIDAPEKDTALSIVDRHLNDLRQMVTANASFEFKDLVYSHNPFKKTVKKTYQWEPLTSMRNVDSESAIRVYSPPGARSPWLDNAINKVRKSQLIVPFGPGAILELKNSKSAISEVWLKQGESLSLAPDERFLSRLRCKDFISPPTDLKKPIYAALFPEWGYCRRGGCRRFGRITTTFQYNMKKEKWGCLCEGSRLKEKPKYPAQVIQIKFVAVCQDGHITDLPWDLLLHKNNAYESDGKTHAMRYYAIGETGGLGEEGLKCSCGKGLSFAQLKKALEKAICPGSFYRKGDERRKSCNKPLEVKHRGASSVYFPLIRSSIYIPPNNDQRADKIIENLKAVLEGDGPSFDEEKKREIVEDRLSKEGVPREKAWQLYTESMRPDDDLELTSSDQELSYRHEEYMLFCGNEENPVSFLRDLEFSRVKPDELSKYPEMIEDVRLISILKETRAILGYTRVYPLGMDDEHGGRPSGAVKKVSTVYDGKVPAVEVRGEGVFIRLNIERIKEWVKSYPTLGPRLNRINDLMRSTGRKYGVAIRNITPGFVLTHTLSHLLIRRLGFECGYNTASLRERIYYDEIDGDIRMCGVMIYTSAGDAEGSLGGLVRQGRPDRFPVFFKNAVAAAERCSSDPLCYESGGQGRESLNLAACHACCLLPETSCEFQNVYLDRGMLIGYPHGETAGYFQQNETKKKITQKN